MKAKCGKVTTEASVDTQMDDGDDSNPQQGGGDIKKPSPTVAAAATANIDATAKALEHLLFQQSQGNIKDYQDLSTLDSRLRDLMTVLVRRRMMKRTLGTGKQPQQSWKAKRTISGGSKAASTTNNAGNTQLSTRKKLLLQILGKVEFNRIEKLVLEIAEVKTKRVATFCGQQSCVPLRLCGQTFQTNLPSVVRQLYFETPLVDSWQRYPMEKLSRLPWKEMVHQAQSNLLAYQMWEMELGQKR